MAISVLVLIITGLQIHFPGMMRVLGAANAVSTHNFFAVVLMLNAFLALFYHLATAAIRQFLPDRQGVAEAVKLPNQVLCARYLQGAAGAISALGGPQAERVAADNLSSVTECPVPIANCHRGHDLAGGNLSVLRRHARRLDRHCPAPQPGVLDVYQFPDSPYLSRYNRAHGPGPCAGMIDGYEEVEVGANAEGERV